MQTWIDKQSNARHASARALLTKSGHVEFRGMTCARAPLRTPNHITCENEAYSHVETLHSDFGGVTVKTKIKKSKAPKQKSRATNKDLLPARTTFPKQSLGRVVSFQAVASGGNPQP